MNFKLYHRIIAAFVFLITAVVLFSTLQPSVSFWDCGEFIASSYYLQVPHPPGTPFFLLLGRIFAMIPFAENIGQRINTISVLASASSILLLYLIAVKLIQNYRGKQPANLFEALAIYISSAIGALSFAFSDTFWFNGTEAEVYAFSTFLFAGVTYLIIRWNERADNADSGKYLIMIAYLLGISTGVHLMSVLAMVPVVMVILFRKYLEDESITKQTGYIFIAHIVIILILAIAWWSGQKDTTPPMQEAYEAFDSKFKMFILGISLAIFLIFWKKIFNRSSFYLPIIIGSLALFFVYPGVVKLLPAIMTSIAGNDLTIEMFLLALIFIGLGYGMYYATKNNKPTMHLVFTSMLFVMLGFTTFAMVIIRSNQNPPMNENEPNDFTELVSYLNREQYGDFPIFKRRFSSEPHQMGIYTDYSSDFDFFYSFQMNHMMTRYLFWNYAGREGWNQDDGANIAPFNDIGNIFGKILAINFAGDIKDSLFGIPLLIGLLGIYFHFRRDWKMASIFMIMFIMMGYLTAFYQNQQQPQPRERDYFYVGAFFVFSIWIAIGVMELFYFVREKIKSEQLKNAAAIAVLAVAIILIPVKMIMANYHTHDRSNNWVPWDYSYNLLQSCAPNAVLFTNGDNDTFPLWYLQDVEGVRRDVRIVNLSLLNTNWYIKQLKNNDPYNVGKVEMRLTDVQIDQMRPIEWKPKEVTIPLPGDLTSHTLSGDFLKQFSITDSSVARMGAVKFTMNNTLTFGEIKAIRVQDLMVREIIEANNWRRPIYFAVTCSEDSKIGIGDYLRMEGMALRLVPEKRQQGKEFVQQELLAAQLIENKGYSKDFKPGFKFRGINDPNIFFDDNQTRMIQNYRNSFLRLAISYVYSNQNDKALETLDQMERQVPRKVRGMDFGLKFELSNIYLNAGGMNQYKEIASELEKEALQKLDDNVQDTQTYYNPYRVLVEIYQNLKEYGKLIDVYQRLSALYPDDQNLKQQIENYKKLAAGKIDSVNQK